MTKAILTAAPRVGEFRPIVTEKVALTPNRAVLDSCATGPEDLRPGLHRISDAMTAFVAVLRVLASGST